MPEWKKKPDSDGLWIYYKESEPFEWAESMFVSECDGVFFDKFDHVIEPEDGELWFGPIGSPKGEESNG